ncbi:unnamed protein product [Arabidopsis lyrata]|uniref:Uncharacterized protein n=1 Tax=Arabidopsis arenosa TaxID=38785 RepID=A0A8S1ZG35_ARAAE|nr:unnamed protein product [Arabidopsis arenosa]CAH8261919.1 unnamed protein product [Arabidopsis lyrata]
MLELYLQRKAKGRPRKMDVKDQVNQLKAKSLTNMSGNEGLMVF